MNPAGTVGSELGEDLVHGVRARQRGARAVKPALRKPIAHGARRPHAGEQRPCTPTSRPTQTRRSGSTRVWHWICNEVTRSRRFAAWR